MVAPPGSLPAIEGRHAPGLNRDHPCSRGGPRHPCLRGGGRLAAEVATPPIRVIIEVPNDAEGRAYVADRLAPAAAQPAKPAPAEPSSSVEAARPGMGSEMPSIVASRLEMLRARAKAIAQ